jgi:hypothetical protein
MQYSKLPKNNKVCLHAWRGAHVMPNGQFLPCCIALDPKSRNELSKDSTTIIDNASLHDVRNHSYWNNLRADLIKGIENSACASCWKNESCGRKSYRQMINEKFDEELKEIDFIETGELDNNKIIYWDLRESNVCNMKCVMCGPALSSQWQKESLTAYGKVDNYNWMPVKDSFGNFNTLIVTESTSNLKEEILNNLEHTKQIYFAGGEPLITNLHYKILDILIENNKTDVHLFYNTNLSKLNYKNLNVLDYWNKFNNVVIGASIDAYGKRAEWARYGTKWSIIHNNVEKILTECPNVKLGLNVTSSFYTIGGLPTLLKWASKVGINGTVDLSILDRPEYFSIKILPLEYRKKLITKIEPLINSNVENWSYLKKILETPVTKRTTNLQAKAKETITALDKIRNTSIIKHCPDIAKFYIKW